MKITKLKGNSSSSVEHVGLYMPPFMYVLVFLTIIVIIAFAARRDLNSLVYDDDNGAEENRNKM
jgi:hypothetical protein